MPKYRKGIESFPLTQYDKAPYPIMVFVIDLQNEDEVVAQYELDYSKFDDRKRIGQLTYWAIRNNHSIETMAFVDAQPEYQNG